MQPVAPLRISRYRVPINIDRSLIWFGGRQNQTEGSAKLCLLAVQA